VVHVGAGDAEEHTVGADRRKQQHVVYVLAPAKWVVEHERFVVLKIGEIVLFGDRRRGGVHRVQELRDVVGDRHRASVGVQDRRGDVPDLPYDR